MRSGEIWRWPRSRAPAPATTSAQASATLPAPRAARLAIDEVGVCTSAKAALETGTSAMPSLLLRRVIGYGYRVSALYDFHTISRSLLAAMGMGVGLLFFIPYARMSLLHLGLICLGGAGCYALILSGSFRFNLRRLMEHV